MGHYMVFCVHANTNSLLQGKRTLQQAHSSQLAKVFVMMTIRLQG
jgi:hypothetical protein